jgi:hypothetical protein
LLLEDGRRLEHDYATRRDGRFLTSLGIAAHALAFLAHDKQAERRQLYRFATLQAVRDFVEHELNEFGGFDSRQAGLLTDRASHKSARVTVLPDIVLMTLEPTRYFCHSCGPPPIYTDV